MNSYLSGIGKGILILGGVWTILQVSESNLIEKLNNNKRQIEFTKPVTPKKSDKPTCPPQMARDSLKPLLA